MTIRFKILALSTALLAILCIALFVSLRLQENVHEEIGGITEYHIPIGTAVADVDVATFEYELNLRRLLQQESPGAEALARAEKRERELVATINQAFDHAEATIAKAIADPRNDLSDRLSFARMLGTFSVLRREAAPFEELGLKVLQARHNGDDVAARRLLGEFQRFERSFGASTSIRASSPA